MAFKDYSISDGIKGIFTSEWVGLSAFGLSGTAYILHPPAAGGFCFFLQLVTSYFPKVGV
ncbi:hypothetical protein [Paenibacillus terreus]|uniref:hypothetical protein n=1 Tax=Paenibacillus terreus TaxID=1387834 RepID=UPI0035CD0EF3